MEDLSLTLHDIPESIILFVFSFLDFHDRNQAAQVCQSWNRISKDRTLTSGYEACIQKNLAGNRGFKGAYGISIYSYPHISGQILSISYSRYTYRGSGMEVSEDFEAYEEVNLKTEDFSLPNADFVTYRCIEGKIQLERLSWRETKFQSNENRTHVYRCQKNSYHLGNVMLNENGKAQILFPISSSTLRFYDYRTKEERTINVTGLGSGLFIEVFKGNYAVYSVSKKYVAVIDLKSNVVLYQESDIAFACASLYGYEVAICSKTTAQIHSLVTQGESSIQYPISSDKSQYRHVAFNDKIIVLAEHLSPKYFFRILLRTTGQCLVIVSPTRYGDRSIGHSSNIRIINSFDIIITSASKVQRYKFNTGRTPIKVLVIPKEGQFQEFRVSGCNLWRFLAKRNDSPPTKVSSRILQESYNLRYHVFYCLGQNSTKANLRAKKLIPDKLVRSASYRNCSYSGFWSGSSFKQFEEECLNVELDQSGSRTIFEGDIMIVCEKQYPHGWVFVDFLETVGNRKEFTLASIKKKIGKE
eukprot:TRINITY_DN678_c0_g4_i4.p1 TRINITY_DN678_c0_g4~~TRINITY_DN678_c0_g4_i4.p1  ORF type:complete len:528 (-),score=53.67 TRINITY_DN678_c0_g4_i4:201-1784(-)